MLLIINTLNDKIVNKKCNSLKEATEFLKPYFEEPKAEEPEEPEEPSEDPEEEKPAEE